MHKVLPKLVLFVLLLPFTARSQGPGDNFFSPAMVHEIRLNFPQTYWWDSLVAAYNGEYYITCDVTIDGNVLYGIGAKFKGNSSYNNPSQKKSFKLDFNRFVPGQDYDNLKKLNLNNGFKDPTFLREKTCLDFLINHNVPAPRCSYANVYLNDTLWGLYMVVEEIDDEFMNRWFGDNNGNLFKGDPTGDMQWYGSSPSSYYSKYELHNNDLQNDWTDLVSLLNVVNNAPLANLHNDLDTIFNIDRYLYYWAATNLFVNLDSYMGSGHNYYIYHDSATHKFEFIAWDVNEAFGVFSMGMNVTQLESLAVTHVPSPATQRPLHNRMLQNTTLKQKLYDAVCDLINMDFSIWNMEWYIDSLANVVRPYVYADPKKFYTNQNFEDNLTSNITIGGGPGGGTIPGLKSFLINRRNSLAAELNSNGCTVGIAGDPVTEAVQVFPNPFSESITLVGSPGSVYSYELRDMAGKLHQIGSCRGNNSVQIAADLSPGIYLLIIKNNTFEVILNQKLVKH